MQSFFGANRSFLLSVAMLLFLALGNALGQSVPVTVSTTQDFDKKPVAITQMTQAKVKATATEPGAPPYCTVDPPSAWTWTWQVVAPPPNATVSVTQDAADPTQATVSASFSDSGEYTIAVQASVSIGSSCGATWTGSGYSTLFVTAVKVKAIQYSVDGMVFQDATSTLFVPLGSAVTFKALPSPDGASWPAGYPVWGGSSGATGTGDVTVVTFNTLSTDGGDFKTVTATCGNTETANVIVYDFDIVFTPAADFENRSYERYGIGETINLSYKMMPSVVTPSEIGGLRWEIESGGGDITNGDNGVGTYVCSDEDGSFVLKLFISGGPFLAQKEKKKAAFKDLPTLSVFVQTGGVYHEKGCASVGFKAEVFLEPTNVSFDGLVWREGKCKPSKATGHFEEYKEAEHAESIVWVYIAKPEAGKGSRVMTKDLVKDRVPPEKVLKDNSEFIWDIPHNFLKKNGSSD